ncbi:MAG TPA: hypothetical protein VG244_00570 [Acidimicrobiales bacterium]|nr:hypothetical protein [Acidimicrobiales bacterium]
MSSDDVPEENDSPEEGAEVNPPHQDAEVDEVDEESFPASDPPSSWAGPSSEK